jgi:hypothetical protein
LGSFVAALYALPEPQLFASFALRQMVAENQWTQA